MVKGSDSADSKQIFVTLAYSCHDLHDLFLPLRQLMSAFQLYFRIVLVSTRLKVSTLKTALSLPETNSAEKPELLIFFKTFPTDIHKYTSFILFIP